MVYGIHGKFGIVSDTESATCRTIEAVEGSNPTHGTPSIHRSLAERAEGGSRVNQIGELAPSAVPENAPPQRAAVVIC